MSFSFKELLAAQKAKKKAKKSKGKADGASTSVAASNSAAAAAEEEEEEQQPELSLGPFPKSVHKLWSARRRGWERAPLAAALPATGGGFAVCLTVVDKVPHEELWRRWIEGAAADPRGRTASLHVHAKHPDKLKAAQPWVGERTLEHSYVPEWNDVKVARAMLALLADALKDPTTQFMMLMTESCVPLLPFTAAADRLWAEGRGASWLRAWQVGAKSTKFEEQSQFGMVDADIVPPQVGVGVVRNGAAWLVLLHEPSTLFLAPRPQHHPSPLTPQPLALGCVEGAARLVLHLPAARRGHPGVGGACRR